MFSRIEKSLAEIYKPAPALPTRARKTFTTAWPWLALLFAGIQLAAAVALWRRGHDIISALDSQFYLGDTVQPGRNLFYWLGLFSLVADGLILFIAYLRLSKNRLSGWRLLLAAAIVNVIYGIFAGFDNHSGIVVFSAALLVSGAMFYLLFQTRAHYTASKRTSTATTH